MIEFGRNKNQVFHTFRHVDEAGLGRMDVRLAILQHLRRTEEDLAVGPYTGRVQVKGVSIEFRAYRFEDGSLNVGRITVVSPGSETAHGGGDGSD